MSPSIRVLLIEDNPIEARLTQKWLDNTNGDSFQVEWVERMDQGLDRLTRTGIDLVLSDLNLPDSEGLDTFLRLHTQSPSVPIVVLTGKDDEALGALAVASGAQDYLVKQQLDVTKLARVLQLTLMRHRVHENQRSKPRTERLSRVIGFLGAKGGAGTTTVAVNVATALAKQQESVILAEVRPSFGTLAYLLRQEPKERNLRTLFDRFPGGFSEEDVLARLCKGPSGSRVLFGPQQEDAYKELDSGQTEALVKLLSKMADFVILDLPSQPSCATQAAVSRCNAVAVVTERELGSVQSGKVTLDQLQSWGVGGDSTCAVVVSRNEYLKPIELDEISARLGCEIVGTIPLATSANLETSIVRAQEVAASFAELGKSFATSKLAEIKV